jgi:flagellar basal body P-ring formation protein FlgA
MKATRPRMGQPSSEGVNMKLLAAMMALLLPAAAHAGGDAAVRSALETAARRALPDTVVEIEVHTVSARGKVDVPDGAELRVRVSGDEDWLGRIAAEVDVSLRGDRLGTLTVTAEVAAYVEVPVTRATVSRGTPLGPTDIAHVRRDVASLPRGTVLDSRALTGRLLKRDLGLNQLLRESDLEERLDARRNQPVTLMLSRGSLRVTAPGVLRRDARIGDLVEVLSVSTQTTVHGILTGPSTVELMGALPMASSDSGRNR